MIRGTTAQFKFKLPYSKDEFDWIRIKFWQSNNPSSLLPITKSQDHCSSTDKPNEICTSLTSEETARFSDKYKATVQLRAFHTTSGTILGNHPQLVPVYPMRDDIIEEDPTMPPVNNEGWIILDGHPVVD